MSRTQHYILFDSSCSLCSDVAADIERASGGALTGESLYAPQAKTWLDRARPGWKFEPTLVQVQGDDVRAYTGMTMRAHMLTFLNPLQLLKVARVVQQAGVPLFGSFEAHEPEQSRTGDKSAELEPALVDDDVPAPHSEPTAATLPLGFRMTDEGPEIGTLSPEIALTTTTGKIIPLVNSPENTLLLFVSTSCSYCRGVAGYLQEFSESAPEQLVLVFSTAEPEPLNEFITENRLENLPVVISPQARSAFSVIGIPYAFALDTNGTIRGKGIVNNADHLDSLANTLYISVETFKQALAYRKEDKVEVI